MTTVTKEILPGTGLEKLRFGMDRTQVKQQLGEPDEIEQFEEEDSGEVLNEAWHFDDLELSLSFDKDEDWRLSTISVSNPDFTLQGENVIGLLQEDLISMIERLELGAHESEEWANEDEDEENQIVVAIPERSINFWFTAGKVSEVQWGPLYTADDQTIWPN